MDLSIQTYEFANLADIEECCCTVTQMIVSLSWRTAVCLYSSCHAVLGLLVPTVTSHAMHITAVFKTLQKCLNPHHVLLSVYLLEIPRGGGGGPSPIHSWDGQQWMNGNKGRYLRRHMGSPDRLSSPGAPRTIPRCWSSPLALLSVITSPGPESKSQGQPPYPQASFYCFPGPKDKSRGSNLVLRPH